jgi:hypothetical protein
MTSVLLGSEATSTTVCRSRSCSAAGPRAITSAAAASRLDAWYSPSAVMILARLFRLGLPGHGPLHALGQRDVLISTRSTRMPHGPSAGSSITRRSSRLTWSRSESSWSISDWPMTDRRDVCTCWETVNR